MRRTLALLALLASACASEGPAAEASGAGSLAGTSWVAERIGDVGVVEGAQTALTFEPDGRVAGKGGCNHFFGPVMVSGQTIRFGALAGTRMACATPLMNQEQRFFAALGQAQTWQMTADGHLIFADAAGEPVVVFSRAPAGGSGG